METLNKISIIGLSTVLLITLATTANATALIQKQCEKTSVVDKKVSYQKIAKASSIERDERSKYRTTLGMITDKKYYK